MAAKLAVGLAILFQPREVEYGEAVIHDKATRLLHGKPLYHPYDQPPYSVAIYTPLFYVLGAGLQAVLVVLAQFGGQFS